MRPTLLAAVLTGLATISFSPPLDAQTLPVPTTLEDFTMPGSQPGAINPNEPIIAGTACNLCHFDFPGGLPSPRSRWSTSIMAQAARDPLFHACLTIANQDAAFAGDLCIRCHTPAGWLAGNSTPTDGSALTGINDWDGVTCNFCHRLVDPIYTPGVNPSADQGVISQVLAQPGGALPVNAGSGQYLVDHQDRRRGPYNLGGGFSFHEWLQSPYHRESMLCGTCHDVSNPVFIRVGDAYVPDTLDAQHPTHDKYDQFPVERTFSEWQQSEFGLGPVEMGGRFGGNITAVSTCQDCHMPKTTGSACYIAGNQVGATRTDQPLHDFAGSQTWVLDAIQNLDTTFLIWDTPAYMDPVLLEETKTRNIAMLEAASDLELSKVGTDLQVRVVNHSGHKLPTGYPEGRRIWVNVRFRDANDDIIIEHGHYDFDTAVLTTDDTKVYEAKLGLDATMAGITGLPAGESFHFAINNTWLKDNRIPPRGFTNAGFESVQAAPVAYTYADGQYWDDTLYPIPSGAVTAEVRVYYQTASKEYVEFLWSENTTDNKGQILYDQWLLSGKGPPVIMDFQTIDLLVGDFSRGDCNVDQGLDVGDPIFLLAYLFSGGAESPCEGACDGNDDGSLNIGDAVHLLAHLFSAGAAPPAPFPDCGADPTMDALTCVVYLCP